jgi:pimeloyl-ACP methyl ester carboxylesterase
MERHDHKHEPNILLVHGAFADGSIWTQVIQNLQQRRFNVVASQLPLISFSADVKTVQRDLAALAGPTVVVGHSYGGVVIRRPRREQPTLPAWSTLPRSLPTLGKVSRTY